MRFPFAFPFALLLLALASGCAYLRDRAADAADILTFEAGAGYGLHGDVKVTDYAHLGVGYAHLRKVGFRGREVVWMRDREVGLPLSALLVVGAAREGSYARLGHLHANIPDLLSYEDPWRRADIEAGGTTGVLSLRVGISPGHLVDFLAGLAGFDPAGDDRGLEIEDPAEPDARWLAGDLHGHVSPPDNPGHATMSAEDSADLAAANGLDFASWNPHLWSGSRRDRHERVVEFAATAATLVARAELPIMPGYETTGPGRGRPEQGIPPDGHALILFRHPKDAFAIEGAASAGPFVARALEKLPARDRLFIPTHPRTRRIEIPFFSDHAAPWPPVDPAHPERSRRTIDYAALPEKPLAAYPFDGLEALTFLHHLAELAVGRSGEDLAIDDVFRVLDARIAAERRRYIATGGSDNHRDVIPPTLWVLSLERSRDAIFDALVGGRIVVGGPEACGLEARSDLEARWRPIGADLRAGTRVELRWRGTGTLVVDGRAIEARSGAEGHRHEVAPGSFHFYRLEAGPGRRSRSNWIYVNR